MEITFANLVKHINTNNVYMFLGNGSKNQFKDLRNINKIVNNIVAEIPHNSILLYFGDSPNKKKPDVGYLFELVSSLRKDISIYMIQINEAKSWGVPKFVKAVYWHNDYTQDSKWGGLKNKQPCSNTKKWVSLNKKLKNGITKVFILGGGAITLDDYSLIKKHKIPYQYYHVERKYKGDGKTKITNNMPLKERIGITYGKITNK